MLQSFVACSSKLDLSLVVLHEPPGVDNDTDERAMMARAFEEDGRKAQTEASHSGTYEIDEERDSSCVEGWLRGLSVNTEEI